MCVCVCVCVCGGEGRGAYFGDEKQEGMGAKHCECKGTRKLWAMRGGRR